MHKLALGVVFAAGLLLTGTGSHPTALAQGLSIGPGGVTVDPYGPRRERRDDRIGRREATEIARQQGMVDVVSVDRDEGEYRVRGEDRRGRRMRVVIDAYSGRVVEVVRRDDD